MKTKKLLALLMAGAMSVSVLSGCGGCHDKIMAVLSERLSG